MYDLRSAASAVRQTALAGPYSPVVSSSAGHAQASMRIAVVAHRQMVAHLIAWIRLGGQLFRQVEIRPRAPMRPCSALQWREPSSVVRSVEDFRCRCIGLSDHHGIVSPIRTNTARGTTADGGDFGSGRAVVSTVTMLLIHPVPGSSTGVCSPSACIRGVQRMGILDL